MGRVNMDFKYQGAKTHDTAEGLRKRLKAHAIALETSKKKLEELERRAQAEVDAKVRKLAR